MKRFRVSIILLILTAALIVTSGLWLTGLYRFLDVSEGPRKAEIIVLLGGGKKNRLQKAASLFNEGFGQRFLISGGPLYEYGIECSTTELTRKEASRLGIPQDSLILIKDANSTWDEAGLVDSVLRVNGFRRAIIVTDAEHTRRARAVYRKRITDEGVDLTFVSSGSVFPLDGWWRSELGLLAIQNEYLKLLFYSVHYGVWPWYW